MRDDGTSESSPARSPIHFGAAAAAFAVALALYAATLAPTVTLIDSGALIVASNTLGVAHPPGFPLYTILARVASLAPLGDPARRVNFASALFAALAVAMLTLAAREALLAMRSARGERLARAPLDAHSQRGGDDREPATHASADAATVAASLAAGLAFATSRTLWSYAIVAEVYALGTFLALAALAIALRAHRTRDAERYTRLAALAGFVFGLALAVHHLTAAVALPSLAILFATRGPRDSSLADRSRDHRASAGVLAALGTLVGLSIYAYLPVAASRTPAPPLLWGDPRSLEKLWWHVSGWQYRFQIAASGASVTNDARAIAGAVVREFGAPWFPLVLAFAVIGLVALARSHRRLFAALATLIVANIALLFAYHVKEDRDAYFLPMLAAIALCAAVGVDRVARRLSARLAKAQPREKQQPDPRITQYAPAIALGLAVALGLAAVLAHYRALDRSRDTIGRDYATNALAPIAHDGVLLTGDWNLYSALLYLREVERVRTDVAVIDFNQLWRTWYVDALRRREPDVVAPVARELDAFCADLRIWERDPAGFDSDAARTDGMNARFQELIVALARAHVGSAPSPATPDSGASAADAPPSGGASAFYLTQDLPTKYGGPMNDIMKALSREFAFVPEGLVMRLTRDRTFAARAAPTPPLELRSLTSGAVAIAPESVIARDVVPAYVTSFTMRATYLAMNGAWDDALAALDGAESLAPGSSAATALRAQIADRRAAAGQ